MEIEELKGRKMDALVREIVLAAKWLVYQKGKEKIITIEDCMAAILRVKEARNKIYSTVYKAFDATPISEENLKEADALERYIFHEDLKAIVTKNKHDVDDFLRCICERVNAKKYGDMLDVQAHGERTVKTTSDSSTKESGIAWVKSIASVKDQLNEKVIGQPCAIEAVCDALHKRVYRSERNRPVATFLFAGASGTGKTLLANQLAAALGDDWKTLSVQMEVLTSDNQGFAINGLTRGYGTSVPGAVTDFVRKNPRSVVIFENFDKAHPNIRTAIEPLFTTGILVDQHGFFELKSNGRFDYSQEIASPEVPFHDTVVIFTTSAGEDVYDSPTVQMMTQDKQNHLGTMLLKALSRLGDGENNQEDRKISSSFLRGLSTGTVVFLNKLKLDSLVVCAKKNIQNTLPVLKENLGYDIRCESIDLICKALLLSFAPDVSPLNAKDALLEKIMRPLMRFMAEQEAAKVEHICIRFASGEQQKLEAILNSFHDDPISQMFRKSQTLHVDISVSKQQDVIVVEVGGFELQRVSHAHDFQGEGAVRAIVPDVSFQDIAGHSLVKKRLTEIVKVLKRSDRMKTWDIDTPKGILLWGDPGTGKTLLAKALAHESELPFISTTGSELLDMNFVKMLFKRARKYAPSILFIDEIDALGVRGKNGFDVIINQLLTEIDGFETSLSQPVFIIAATNLPHKVDSALVRSGRIDLKIRVPMLDREARTYFVDQYFKLPHDQSLDREVLLDFTTGMNGADLEKVRREAMLEMIYLGKDKLTLDMLIEQINTIKYGIRSTNTKLLQALNETAYHEAGHAIVSMVVNPDIIIEQVSVMPRERMLGFVSFDEESLKYRRINRQEVLDHMCVALAGRVAQSKQFAEFGDDSGASNDIQKATLWAQQAICVYGLDEEVGDAVLVSGEKMPSLTESDIVLKRTQAWLQDAKDLCKATVDQHWDLIDALAKRLIKDEVVTGEVLRRDFSVSGNKD